MRPVAKVGLVAAGYAAAVAIAFLVTRVYITLTDTPDRQASGGMYAFGDGMLFLAVLGLAAIPATSAALYFLRPHPRVWGALSIASLVVAASGIMASLVHLGTMHSVPGSIPAWSPFATLWVLVAPLWALGFFLAGLFAPTRGARIRLLTATALEIAALGVVAISWIRPLH